MRRREMRRDLCLCRGRGDARRLGAPGAVAVVLEILEIAAVLRRAAGRLIRTIDARFQCSRLVSLPEVVEMPPRGRDRVVFRDVGWGVRFRRPFAKAGGKTP